MTSTDTKGISDAQLTEHLHARGFNPDPIDVAMIREGAAAIQEAATGDCDQAFEEHYKCSARDPSNAGDLAIWRAAWGAKGGDALAAIKALQDRIDTLNSSLECEKRMRKDSDERMENAEAALKSARVQALEEAARICDEQQTEGECPERASYCAAAIRLLGEDAGKPVECTTCGALVVGVAPAWKDVRTHGLPPCDGETVYAGENEAGYMGCFNAYSDEACWMDTPEYTYNVMSGLRFWRVQDRPDAIRRLGEEA